MNVQTDPQLDAPMPAPAAPAAAAPSTSDELLEVMRAYNQVTEQLRRSHDTLTNQVARLQRELASANEALQRSRRLAALGEMAAGIAHEIRNPLASMQLYAGMLIEDLEDRRPQQQISRQIAQAVRGLNAVVSDVLTFSRELRVERRRAPAWDAATRAVAAVRPLIEQHGINIVVDCGDVKLNADAELLHQALVNLCRNAAQAMEGGGTLRITAQADDEGVTLTVADTGSGIAAEQIDRIFNPFFTTRHTGTGLGLAIVHRIVDAHGGGIAVHNDGGAVFTLTLPQVDQAPPADERN